ncbi:TIGR02679 domain-containing protein [Brevibacillus brevis]|uniref:TIGR02679 domain-containing protein n=1 Tax=Brevibacillus brevis TaxID=1393 RepID=UPI000D10C5C2|nr:TIGR02679 domain-containing protein [Brevibacillus brevis]PSJ68699.1 hypothetical protein C7J99_13700 [Brevibacillus brevis]RED33131.1 uncharacterized protein (TIGR02679 family) [Brevibacillus brevis]GEC93302.1 hypothetical protein BBR01nite_56330 [Brevibacillus brevis]VEF90801.1 Protein of uncharacterised function N-terminus (DUF3323) [Brevibacillus brevis]
MTVKDIKDAVAFFKSDEAYEKFFLAMIKKVKRDGRFSGTVKLKNLTLDEQRALSGLFRKDINTREYSTTFEKFGDILKRTPFCNVAVKDLLEAYVNEEPLISRREMQAKINEIWDIFWISIENHASLKQSSLITWFQELKQKKGIGYRFIRNIYYEDSLLLQRFLEIMIDTFLELSLLKKQNKYVRLPMLATKITGYPHDFDTDKRLGKMLIFGLCHITSRSYPTSTEDLSELYFDNMLLRDDISSSVTCCGLKFLNISESGIVISIPLRTIVRSDYINPIFERMRERIVYVIENPSVFSAILDRWEAEISYFQLPPMVCSSGQFQLSTLALLDRLGDNNFLIKYSGDFDPEGMGMAYRILKRLRSRQAKVQLWRYTLSDYEISVQTTGLDIKDKKRWVPIEKMIGSNVLGDMENPFLDITRLSLKTARIGYQEALVDRLYEDIIGNTIYAVEEKNNA